jgi:competence protein ComEA
MSIRIVPLPMIAAITAALFVLGASGAASAQTAAPAKPAAPVTTTATKPAAVTQKVDINTATAAELDALPQIGEKRSEAIIKNRPYKTTDELVSKKVLSKGVYDKIKASVVVR